MTYSTAQQSIFKRYSASIVAFIAVVIVTAGMVGVAYKIQQRLHHDHFRYPGRSPSGIS